MLLKNTTPGITKMLFNRYFFDADLYAEMPRHQK
jgi:hypothetical protein